MVRLSHIYSIIFILLVYGFCYSDTHYVSLNGTNDAGGGYANWVGAATQIQWAVDFAVDGETVLVSNGTYFCGGIYTNISLITTNSGPPPTTNWPTTNTAMVVITNSITLKSFSGFYTNTVINGNYPAYTNARGIYIANTGAVLDGFTVTNCFSTNQSGAGFFANPCKLITNCLITGNTVSSAFHYTGMGGYVNKGYVSHCSFVGNRKLGDVNYQDAGAGLLAPSSIVSNCIISANSGANAYWQGYTRDATGVNCVISGNIGVGVGLDYGACLLSCIVSNNTGDGIDIDSGTMRNCLVVKNGGRGIYTGRWSGYNIEIENCTIANNGGIGVYMYNRTALSLPQFVANSIIYNNKGGNWGYDNTNNIVYTNCCTIPIPTNVPGKSQGTGNITNTPLFANTNIANYRLNANSPCVNAGTNRTWMTNTYDLDGKQRIRYGIVDMGAYERIYEGSLYKFH